MIEDDFLEELRRKELAAERARERDRQPDSGIGTGTGGPPPAEVVRDETASAPAMHEVLRSTATSTTGDDIDTGTGSGNRRLDALVKHHAPRNWTEVIAPERVQGLVESGDTATMIVLSADIRRSTLIMRETIDFKQFAAILSEFVTAAARFIRWGRGWFDKFTGDGLLAYWIVDEEEQFPEYLESAMQTAYHVLKIFNQRTLNRLKANARNFPAGVGMSVGLDAGPTHLVKVAHALTVVGHPVVGAVRMCDAAKDPGQLVCNVRVGEEIYHRRDELLTDKPFTIERLMGATKEYEAQETYLVQFQDLFEA